MTDKATGPNLSPSLYLSLLNPYYIRRLSESNPIQHCKSWRYCLNWQLGNMLYEYLAERRVFYSIRLPSNKVLQYEIAPLLIRPVGRPPKRPVILYDDFWYRAGSWDRARRVVAKVEWHRGELFPRVGFIVTNMTAGPEGVVRFYNGRGTAEQWIKEGKYALLLFYDYVTD